MSKGMSELDDYLVEQRALSPQTVAGYRDAFTLFLTFAHQNLGKWPATMNLSDITPTLTLAFLDHLEMENDTTAYVAEISD